MDSGSGCGFLRARSAANGGSNNGDGAQGQQQQQAPAQPIREQDRLMPIANVIRIMRRVLPPHAKISDDAKETIQECVSEYISFITGEANERCQREQRKTITAEDVLWAMSRLGFDDYVDPLSVYLHRYREFEGEARGVGGLPPGAARGGGGGGGGGDHHSMAPPPMLKPRGAAMPPHHHHDMQLHHASVYGAATAAAMPPHHGHGFAMPHHGHGNHQYLPYPYDPASYGGEHAMAAYYGGSGGAGYAPGNGGDGSGSSGGSASQGGGFEHQHPFASYK
jgi:histone H3/H4